MAGNQTDSDLPQQSFTANALADYIRRLFHVESGGDPNAVTGSNRGLGQFGPTEERKYGITAANRGDYGAQADAVAREYAENNARLARVLGRAPTFADHYFTHQQGAAGGPALLSADPQTPAWQVIRPFYSSYEGRRSGGVPRSADWWAQKAITGNIPSDSPLARLPVDQISAGGMTGLWRDRFNRGLTRVGLSGEAPPVPAEAGPVSPALQNAMQPSQATNVVAPSGGVASASSPLAPPVSGVQSLLAGLGSPDNKGTGTFGDISKSLLATAGKAKGLPFPDAAKFKPFEENLRPLPLSLPNFAAMAQIPKFAEGGIVDRPTVAMVGESGPEAIVPLRPMTMAEPDVVGNRIGAVPAVHNFMSDLLTVLKNKAARVATAPLDAFTGRMQVSDPVTGMPTTEAMNRGSEVAGMAMTGAMPFARPGSAGIFGGRLAQGANLSELEAAKTFAEHNAHPDDIWKSTGWFQGADAKWRHEIPDTSAKFSRSPPASGKLPDLLTEHPLLYAAYPQLKDANFKIVPGGEGASYLGKIKNAHTFEFGEKMLNRDPSAVLHEVQHAVQGEEGFAMGGTMERGPYKSPFEEDLRKLRDEREGIYKKYKSALDRPPDVAARLKQINKVTSTNLRLQDAYAKEAFLNYRRLTGETEARNVQERFRKMLSNYPQRSEDIPRSEQIVSPFAVMTGPKAVGLPRQMTPVESMPQGFDPFRLQR